MPNKNLKKKKCVRCGTVYQPKSGNSQYCNLKCRRARDIEAARNNPRKKVSQWDRFERRKCTSCGGEYRPTSKDQTTCTPECEHVQALMARAAKTRKLRKCLKCGEKFLSDGPWHRICNKYDCQLGINDSVDRNVAFHTERNRQ